MTSHGADLSGVSSLAVVTQTVASERALGAELSLAAVDASMLESSSRSAYSRLDSPTSGLAAKMRLSSSSVLLLSDALLRCTESTAQQSLGGAAVGGAGTTAAAVVTIASEMPLEMPGQLFVALLSL